MLFGTNPGYRSMEGGYLWKLGNGWRMTRIMSARNRRLIQILAVSAVFVAWVTGGHDGAGGSAFSLEQRTSSRAAGAAQTAPSQRTATPGLVKRYDVYEYTFTLPGSEYLDPWEDVDVTVTVTTPSAETIHIGGFYYGPDMWKFRIAPWENGRWRWTAIARDRTRMLSESAGAFTVVESGNPGVVRRSETNPRRLVYDNGAPFQAIGLGDCIPDDPVSSRAWGLDGGVRTSAHDHGRGVDIDTYLSAYGDAGFNLFRWSVDNCAFRLWDTIAPEGNRYLEREGRWGDDLARRLRRHGFRIYMAIFNQPPFPQDTVGSARLPAVARYSRYIVDRYGAFVDFWELMNESDAADGWYAAVTRAVRAADPYRHLISTSWEKPALPGIDIISPHWYAREDEFESDLATVRPIDRWRSLAKPIVFGEQGNLGANWDPRSALRMRIRAWTAFFNEATLIFWNTSGFKGYERNLYLGPEERAFILSLQTFTRDVPADARPISVSVSPPERVRAYGLRSPRMFAAYLHSFADHERSTGGVSIRIDSPAEGQAEWYRPATGTVVRSEPVGKGTQALQCPSFVADIALKIRYPGR